MSIAAQLKNPLVIEQGATFKKRFTWKAGTPPVAIDISNYLGRMQIKDKKGGASIIDLTEANGRVIRDGSNGIIDLLISATDTEALTFTGTAFFDLELEEQTTGFVRRLVEGKVKLSTEVTTI